jgi:RNA polymerase sigma factor (TIGR02999 family)
MKQLEQLSDPMSELDWVCHEGPENTNGVRRTYAVWSRAERMSDATVMLAAIGAGDSQAAEQLLALVYDELRRLAASKLAHESPGQTLQPTALVHEAWLRLVGDQTRSFKDRGHFFRASAEAMRRILIEQARRKQSDKRGGGRQRIDIEQIELAGKPDHEEMLAFDDALTRFSAEDPEAARLVKLR